MWGAHCGSEAFGGFEAKPLLGNTKIKVFRIIVVSYTIYSYIVI